MIYSSINVPGTRDVFYNSATNLFSFACETPDHDDGFSDALFDFYVGLRKLKLLNYCMRPVRTLLLDPYRTCNLACKYCYAHGSPSDHKRVNLDMVRGVVSRYHINRLLCFGGEPLLDVELLKSLLAQTQWHHFFFSTNGLLLDSSLVDGFINKNAISVQVSIEPGEWKQRVSVSGETQSHLLQSRFSSIRKIERIHFRVTIPADAPYVPLKEFVDYLIAETGRIDFSIYYWVEHWPARQARIPRWFKSWVSESVEMLIDDPLKYGNKIVSEEILRVYLKHLEREGFRFSNCSAGYGSIAIGPDSLVHACHESGVVEDPSDVISSDADPSLVDDNKRMRRVYQWANNMSNEVCRNCGARFLCGGVCFLEADKPHATCEFIRETIPLAMAQYSATEPHELDHFVQLSRRRYTSLFSKREGLEEAVRDEEWQQLVSGELPLKTAAELAKRL